MKYCLMLAMLIGLAPSARVTFEVEDSSGAPLKSELVIVQDLNGREREVFRALTDQNGSVPGAELSPGLYRVIATAPYGPWQTEVREFLVKEASNRIIVKVRPSPTHGNGDIVTIGAPWANVLVLKSDGTPAYGAKILARDNDATEYLERWYKTDRTGSARIQILADPLVLVIIFDNALVTTEIAHGNLNPVVRLPLSPE